MPDQAWRTPEMRAKWADNMRRIQKPGPNPAGLANMHAANERRRPGGDLHDQAAAVAAANMRELHADWKRDHPDVPLQHASGVASASINYLCHGCQPPRLIRGPSIFKHQRAKQHTGLTILNQGAPA